MTDFLYQDTILEHYRHPHHWRELPEAEVSSTLSNPSCGDELTVYLVLENNMIRDISFTGVGCAISIAAASMLSDVVIGKKIGKVLDMDKNDIISLLGVSISPARERCSTLALETMKKAVVSAQKIK